jgi:type III secretory pathway component EscR
MRKDLRLKFEVISYLKISMIVQSTLLGVGMNMTSINNVSTLIGMYMFRASLS